ncbi:MAG: hypothetical protein HQK76_18375 [Desulfobacterales bacterium]|nr:hypothetical protein [Desulfobacterales bacterium]
MQVCLIDDAKENEISLKFLESEERIKSKNYNSKQQYLEALQDLLNTAKEKGYTHYILKDNTDCPTLKKVDDEDKDKEKINIKGWNIQIIKGYYTAYRRVYGIMVGLYIGKTLKKAEEKIKIKNKELGLNIKY